MPDISNLNSCPLFDVFLELPRLISWIEKATYHEGRKHVPRSVGDGYGMEMDGSSREWND